MKKIALAVTSLLATSIPEASAERFIEDNLKSESSITSSQVQQFLNELPLEDIEESEKIQNYISPDSFYPAEDWVDGFARVGWKKAL